MTSRCRAGSAPCERDRLSRRGARQSLGPSVNRVPSGAVKTSHEFERAERCLKAVSDPQLFEPFARIPDAAAFERQWADNRHAVLANMAHAAYHPSAELDERMGRVGAQQTRVFDYRLRTTASDDPDARFDAQAFLAVWADKAILTFRGTTSARDWAADLWFLRGRLEGVRVHRGFRRKLRKLWDLIGPELESFVGPARPVWVTGHSLGGALAALAGLRYPFEEVVTFGAPRAGLRLGSVCQARRHVRYHNGADPIVLVPPAWMGYRHHGEVRRITDPLGPNPAYDHSIVYYAEILEMGPDG